MPNDSLVIVHRLKAWIAVSLAVLWLPVANHCRLEAFPILDFLACCDHEEQAPHEDEDCEGDACAVIESGLYKTDPQTLSLAAPQFAPVDFLSNSLDDRVNSGPASHAFPPAPDPSEFAVGWRFVLRTALPPRAPSHAS